MDSAQSIQVIVVADDDFTARGMTDVIADSADIDVVATATSVDAGRRVLRGRVVDVVIVCSEFDDGSGIDLCGEIRHSSPMTSVIMVTADDRPDLAVGAVMAGASAYLLRGVHAEQLLDAVRRVAVGQSLLDPQVTTGVLDRLRGGGVIAQLTDQERRILALIGEGMTNREIAQNMSLAEKTVKNHVSAIFAKLHVERRAQAAVWAYKHADTLDP